jgi:DNA polymerase-4
MGVHSAMPTGQALRVCPELILVSSNFGDYSAKSHEVMDILHQLSGLVEQVSVDEAFVDVTDLPEPFENIARDLQTRVQLETRLPCSIGGATNKLVAKIATDTGKARSNGDSYPRAILIVPPGKEADFLAPLPTKAMWGVGPKMEASLAEVGLHTIGDLAACPEELLIRQFGKNGSDLHRHALGIDDRPLTLAFEAKSISQETTFARDTADLVFLRHKVKELAAKVGYRMRQDGVCAKIIRLKLRWSDFSTHTRQVALPQPTDQDGVISETAEALLMKLWQNDRPVRLIGVGGAGLVERVHQMSLWETPSEKERKLLTALDDLREKYGKKAIQHGDRIKSKENQKN